MSKRKFKEGDEIRLIRGIYNRNLNWDYAYENNRGVIVGYVSRSPRPYLVQFRGDDPKFNQPWGVRSHDMQAVVHTYSVVSQDSFKDVDAAIAAAEKAADLLKAPVKVQDGYLQGW